MSFKRFAPSGRHITPVIWTPEVTKGAGGGGSSLPAEPQLLLSQQSGAERGQTGQIVDALVPESGES